MATSGDTAAMETIEISDDEVTAEEEYLSPDSVVNRFGGESLCERAIIHARNHFDEEVVPLNDFNEKYINKRWREEADKNGLTGQYEINSYLESVYGIKDDMSSQDSADQSDAESVDEIFGDAADAELRQQWTSSVLLKPNEEMQESGQQFSLTSGLDSDESNSSCLAYNSLPVMASESVQKAFFFNKSFLQRLRRLQCRDSKLELSLWPSIAKAISVAAIAGPKSGKTTSYVVPLMNWFDSKDQPQDKSSIGAIVVCSSTRQTYAIAQLAKLWRDPDIANMEQTIKIVSLNTANEKRQMTAVLNGCDILVTTPEPLLRAIRASIVDCTNCKCLIIDEADVSLSVHMDTIRDIYLEYANKKKQIRPHIRNGVVYNPMAFQTMLFAERWTPAVQWFVKEVQHMPNILFGSHYELSIAVGVKCRVEVTEFEKERERLVVKIVKLLTATARQPRIAIVCKTIDEIGFLKSYLKRKINGLSVVEVTHQVPHFDLEQRRQTWKRLGGLLFINDEAIRVVDGFQSCEHIIHYKLPEELDRFGDRYRLMRTAMKSYRNPWTQQNGKPAKELSSHIVVSPIDSHLIPRVVEYLKRLDTPIPDKLVSVFRYIPKLCGRFAAFGVCPFEKSFCADRHLFLDSDRPLPSLPSNGQIKLIVTYVKSANQFFFRLNAFRNETHSSGHWQPTDTNYDQIRPKLNELKDRPFNTIEDISFEEIYGIAVRGEVLRVRVSRVMAEEELNYYEKYDPKDNRQKVEVFCVDFGHKLRSHSRQLFRLPDELKSVPPMALKAYLFGIKPIDNEIEWDFRSTQKLYEMVDNYRVIELTAWVLRQVERTFWLNRLQVSRRLNNSRLRVDANPAQHLIDGKIVAVNERSLPLANTDYNRVVSLWHNHKLSSVTSQTFLVDDSTYVVVSDFVDVDHFYLVREDRVKQLKTLEEKWSQAFESVQPLKELIVDQICFYNYSDPQYDETSLNRAKIVAIDGERVDVFLVDHGEFVRRADRNNLYPILESHLQELPFQAIRVALTGVRPVQPITYELICQLTRDENDIYRMCIADKVSYADGVHQIRLYVADDRYETKYTALSKLLVDAGLAEYVDGEEDNELWLIVEKERPEHEDEYYDDYNEYLENECAANMTRIVLTNLGLISQEDDHQKQLEPKPAAKAESRYTKTVRRMRAIENKKNEDQESDESDSEEQTKVRPIVKYTKGEFTYPFDPSKLYAVDPSELLDQNCDFTDEEGVLEEEEMT